MDIAELRTTASLAMVDLHEDEVSRLAGAIDEMLGYFTMMQQVDIEGVEPTTHVRSSESPVREDRSGSVEGIDPQELVQRASEYDRGHIVIPNVL